MSRNIPDPPPYPPPFPSSSLPSVLLEDDPWKEKRFQKELQFRLVSAIEHNKVDLLKQLVEWGVNANATILLTKTPLIHTLEQPEISVDMIKILLDAGAYRNLGETSVYGTRPIHIVAKLGRVDLAELLLGKSRHKEHDVNLKDNGETTALQIAIHFEHIEMVRYLLEAGAIVDLSDNSGRSPLHRACEVQNTEIADLLLSCGHDINHLDNYYWTPLFHSVFFGHIKMVKYLLHKGAKVQLYDVKGRSLLELAGMNEDFRDLEEGFQFTLKIVRKTSFGFHERERSIPSADLKNRLCLMGNRHLRIQFLNNNLKIFKMLIHAGADPNTFPVNSPGLSRVKVYAICAGARLDPDFVKQLAAKKTTPEAQLLWLRHQLSVQNTLKYQCCLVIRHSVQVTVDFDLMIDRLPLPQQLKDFLEFKHSRFW